MSPLNIVTATMHTYDAFVSYSHKDRQWVDDKLLPCLETAHLRIAIDYKTFEIGALAQSNMERAVESSRHVILVLSPNWLGSEWSGFEFMLASAEDPLSLRQKLIPVLIASADLPRRHSIRTYADLTDPSTYDREMARIIAALRPETRGNEAILTTSTRVETPQPLPERIAVPSSKPWRQELSELVVRSGRAQTTARRALCIEVGVDADGFTFIDAAPRDFAVQLIDLLEKTGNSEALLALCSSIEPVLKGSFAQRLENVRSTVRRFSLE